MSISSGKALPTVSQIVGRKKVHESRRALLGFAKGLKSGKWRGILAGKDMQGGSGALGIISLMSWVLVKGMCSVYENQLSYIPF